MVKAGTLPHHLKILLESKKVLKVGHLVNSDLRMLERACHSNRRFEGGVELSQLARGLYVPLPSQNPSLSDLCAVTLGKCLPKNTSDRVGASWSSTSLSAGQIEYAARDARVSLDIYTRLSTLPPPRPIPDNAPSLPRAGSPVLIFSGNDRLIARGSLVAPPNDGVYDGAVLHPECMLVEVREMVVPGALMSSHGNRALSSFGPTPFCVVAKRSMLRTYQPIVLPPPPPTTTRHSPSQPYDSSSESDVDGPPVIDEVSEDSNAPPPYPESSAARISDIILDLLDLEHRPNAYTRQSEVEIDDEALREGIEVLGSIPKEWRSEIRSRVLKDPFHVFNMFYISTGHGLRVDFARALRDALFLLDPEDVEKINAWGRTQNPPVDIHYLLIHRPRWVLQRCKRVIPPPEQLYPAVAEVFKSWGALKDAKTGLPLFNKNAWKTAKHILEMIYGGFLSDPPGIPLYSEMGIGATTGLMIYRCFRGTNSVEGGVHNQLRSHLPSTGTSVRHSLACLKDYVLRHNLLVCDLS